MIDLEAPPTPKAQRARCVRCAQAVLVVPLRASGLTVMLDPQEVTPHQECPTCLNGYQRKPGVTRALASETYFTRDIACWRCGAAPGVKGYIGEHLSGYGALVGEDDMARPVDLARVQPVKGSGEAVHRAHRCA